MARLYTLHEPALLGPEPCGRRATAKMAENRAKVKYKYPILFIQIVLLSVAYLIRSLFLFLASVC